MSTGELESLEARLERVRSRRKSFRPSGSDASPAPPAADVSTPPPPSRGHPAAATRASPYRMTASSPALSSLRGGGGADITATTAAAGTPRPTGSILRTPTKRGSVTASFVRTLGNEEDRAAAFQKMTDNALNSLEVSSVGSNNKEPGFHATNMSFTQSNMHQIDFSQKYMKAKQRIDALSFQQWHSESRAKLTLEENEERNNLMRQVHQGMLYRLESLGMRLDQVAAEVEAIQEAHRNPSKRLLQMLAGEGNLSPENRSKILSDVERKAAADGNSDNPDGGEDVLDDEVVVMMLDSYARHRDAKDLELQTTITSLRKRVEELESDTDKKSEKLADAAKQCEVAEKRLRTSHGVHTTKWEELKDIVDALEQDKYDLRQTIQQYESQLSSANHRIDELSRKEHEILSACKTGEEKAIQNLVDIHEKEKLEWKKELSHVMERKEQYKERCKSMESIYDECLRGRSMIQSEVMELQEAKRAMQAQATSAVSTMKLQMEKDQIKLKRERRQLTAFKHEKRTKEKAQRDLEESNITSALLDGVPSSGSAMHSMVIGGGGGGGHDGTSSSPHRRRVHHSPHHHQQQQALFNSTSTSSGGGGGGDLLSAASVFSNDGASTQAYY